MKLTNTIWSCILFFVIVFSVGLYATKDATTFENLDREIEHREMLIDSLEQEIFAKDVQLGRYEFALDILKEVDSVAASKYEEQLSNTE